MRYKKHILLLALAIFLLSIAGSCAADTNDTAISIEDSVEISESIAEYDLENIENTSQTVSQSEDTSPVTDENTVTKDTFFSYFDSSGRLLDEVTSNQLNFEGNFQELGVTEITVGKPIELKGNGNAVFNGITFVAESDGVTIDGFSIFNHNSENAIVIGGNSVTISNNFINASSKEGANSYGIHAKAVDDLKIIKNTIVYEGNTDGTVINNPICIEGDDDEDNPIPATGIVISDNTFELKLPSVDTSFDEVTWVQMNLNGGVDLYYCKDVEFSDNLMNLTYNRIITAYGYDSIYAVKVRSNAYSFGEIQSSDITIDNNTINVVGHAYTYALSVCADNFEITSNTVSVLGENNLTHGIDIEGPSATGRVEGNKISSTASEAAYGICSYQYMGAIEDIVYFNNEIETDGYASAGMEVVEWNPQIISNVIHAAGNYTIGIVSSIRDEGIISGNEIVVSGSNAGVNPTGDSLMPKISAGITLRGDIDVQNNTIDSTNIGILLNDDGDITIRENQIRIESNMENLACYAIVTNEENDIDHLLILENNISATAYNVTAIEFNISSCDIINNAVSLNGDYTTGFMASADNLTVKKNNIILTGTGIISYRGTVEITENNIITTGEYTVDIGDSQGSVNRNYLISKEYFGDMSVLTNGQANVHDNFPVKSELNVSNPVYRLSDNKDVSAIYSAKATYKVLVTREGKAVGADEKVTFKYNGKTYTVKTDAKGYATFKPKTKVKVKKYTVTATYKGVTVKNTVTVKHVINAKNAKIKKSKKVNKIKVKTKKVNGRYIKGKKLTLKIKGKKVQAKINKKGVATFKLKKSITKKLKKGKKYKYTVTYGKDKVTKKISVKK